MPIKSRHGGTRGVSVNIEIPWAAQGLTSDTNITRMARFQQRQLMEKEQKLLQLYDQQQQRAHQVAQRGSAGSNTSNSSGSGSQTVTKTTTTSHSTSNSQGGKVRQMFDERRQTTVKGIDRSYPLEPLENKPRKTGARVQKNGNTVASKHSITVKRTIRSDTNGNVNNGKPVINYHEQVTRETFGPKIVHQEEDLDEFYNENESEKWNNGNQDNSGANNYGIMKKETSVKKTSETLIPSGTPRKQESRNYRNMIKIQLGRKSPELGRVSRENVEKSGVRRVSRSAVQMQYSILNRRNSKTFPRGSTPSPREKSKITEGRKESPRKEKSESSQYFETLKNIKKGGDSPRIQSPIFREKPNIDRVKCPRERSKSPQSFHDRLNIRKNCMSPPRTRKNSMSPSHEKSNESENVISLKKLDNCPRSSSHEDDYYPRRKSEFEKSRIFRKLKEQLDRESPEDFQKSSNEEMIRNFRREKSPSPPKYNDSFFRITDYPRRISDFEKSDTFIKHQSSLNEKVSRGESRRRSATPPIVKSSYEKIKESASKRKNSKTTFHKLQEDLDRSSPECKLSSIPSNIREDFPKGKKSESEKSRIFKKLQMELSSSPEPNIGRDNDDYRHNSPTRISLKNDELEISNDFTKTRAIFEKLESVELLKDHLLLNKMNNESNVKYTLDDVDRDLSRGTSGEEIIHKVVKKDKAEKIVKTSPKNSFSTILIQECSFNSPNNDKKCKKTYERTASVESALRKFNSIDNVTIDENSSEKLRKKNCDSRRSSLHAATASWTMKTKSGNQHIHENVSTPKITKKTKSMSLKASKKIAGVKEIDRCSSPSPSCRKQLFTDSESDIASEDTKSSGRTIIIDSSKEFKGQKMELSSSLETIQQPLKILRSIEDIRNSMTRDNKFMDKSTDNIITPKVTIRIISPNTARRTGYINQCVEFGVSKSGNCSEINVKPARRIEKTTSPDDSTRRISSNEGRNVSRNNSDVSLRPKSRESNRGKNYENTQSFDVVDHCDDQTIENPSDNTATRKNSAFVIKLEEESPSKSISSVKKSLNDKQSPEKITSQSRQKVRAHSAISTNSSCSTNQKGNSAASKSRMATRTRGVTPGNRAPSVKANTPASNTDSGLPGCKICGRKFASDRLNLHEQICAKTSQKKRKTFDPAVQRIKGTELEPFVKKLSKKGNDKKTKKPEIKSNWRRKHEDFINAIRSAKQMQAHLAAGGKLSDLPPPPASDTSDYIQCPHCGRKFNQSAAERHIPKCEHMVHNKPNPRVPSKPKR